MWDLRKEKQNLRTITYVHKAKSNKSMINHLLQKSWYLFKDFDVSYINHLDFIINLLGLTHNVQLEFKPIWERNTK
jgi:hypothetical protein